MKEKQPQTILTPAQLNRVTKRAAVVVLKSIVSAAQKKSRNLQQVKPDAIEQHNAKEFCQKFFDKTPYETMRINPWLLEADAHLFLQKKGEVHTKGAWQIRHDYEGKFTDAFAHARMYNVPSKKVSYKISQEPVILDAHPIYKWRNCLIIVGLPVASNGLVNNIDYIVAPEGELQKLYPEFIQEYLDNCMVKNRYVEVWSDPQGSISFSLQKPEAKDVLYEAEDKAKIDRIVRIIDNWDKLSKGERRQGYVLYGPPGTGKTATVSRLASLLEGKATVFNVKGGSQNTLISIYDWLDKIGPNVVIVEDFDTIAPTRTGYGGDNQNIAFISLLLNVLDGARQHDVITLATTNHPEMLDPGITRPGRLGISMKFDEPSPTLKLNIIGFYIDKFGLRGKLNLEYVESVFSVKRVLGCHIYSILHQVSVGVKLDEDPLKAFDEACDSYFKSDNINWKQRSTGKVGY